MIATASRVTCASTCPDGTALSQPPTPVSGDWKSYLSEWSVLGGPADNYEIDDAIASVTWWGFLDDPGGDANPKPFRLTFFTLDGVSGLPCAPAHEYDVAAVPALTGELYDAAPLYEFHAALEPPCPLRRGWIVIEGSASSPSRPFSWIDSEFGDGVSALRAWWGLWYWVETVECAADVNGDGVVNVHDLLGVLGAWNAAGGPADLNGDGVVDHLDMLEVLAEWGPCP
jgi:hypothetical protein